MEYKMDNWNITLCYVRGGVSNAENEDNVQRLLIFQQNIWYQRPLTKLKKCVYK